MTVGKVIFKKRASHTVVCDVGPSKTAEDCCLVWRDQRTFLKDINLLFSEEWMNQYKATGMQF